MPAFHSFPVAVILMSIRFDDANLEAGNRIEPGRQGFVPVDQEMKQRLAIAENVSIHDLNHFYKLFRQYTGMTPRMYRMKYAGEQAED